MRRLSIAQEDVLLLTKRGVFSPVVERFNPVNNVPYYGLLGTKSKVTSSVKALFALGYVELSWSENRAAPYRRVVITDAGRAYLEHFQLVRPRN